MLAEILSPLGFESSPSADDDEAMHFPRERRELVRELRGALVRPPGAVESQEDGQLRPRELRRADLFFCFLLFFQY